MEKIESKTEWLRSLKRGETKVGQLSSPKECHTLSVLIARFNIEEARYKGIRITATYDKSNCRATITGNKIDFYNHKNK